MKKLKTAIIGAGNISGIYLENLTGMFADTIELCAIANNSYEKAQEQARRFGIDSEKNTGALLARKDIDLIVNLTPPQAHYDVAKAALDAGKHIYTEKPLCADLDSAEALLELARKKTLRVGGAPDTFLGAGLLTARKLIDDGWIGRPVAGTAFLMNHGPEHWHPAPAFFYAPGAGPLFDMGPYYLTALVSLLGPVARVTGSTAISSKTRLVTSAPHYGTEITVEIPTHISASLDFHSGAAVSMIMSFDVWSHSLPHIEIYGTEGTIQIGDPNFFISPVRIKRHRAEEWQDMPLFGSADERRIAWLAHDNWRGVGVADMAKAIIEGHPHRASGELALHVLEIMTRILESGKLGQRLDIMHQCACP